MTRDHDVSQLTTAELERTKRQLQANLGLLTPHSPAHVPIQAQMQAIDAELANRTGCDPLAALAREYEAEWKVRKPGRYVADHRRIDVTLVSDSVSGLAEKLRAFTELTRDLP
ncbi:MAG: hypothetical protein ACRDRJ_22645 [Streptosporangiaceae bacterium]